ncbi:hypothetical protein [Mycolicibacterium rhodesiae]|uniref:Restriction endonuclease n=1 Tax=Mycolicibacterium rhodesiae TaxID=36814 RepID=A0A1X0J6K0_MYCRH|nr:hypothetical protein [Mycolicibacterium rhodesiae]MCV7348264.1 hypothetical protein [Mycolicibacterium rhodesiae]ORB57395.1 hypothetical protein BST42_03195 [Mycolicibacterium rhodesiae]
MAKQGSKRVSEVFGLSGTQGTFDFIDVYVDRDIPLFIDPAVLANVDSEWTQECASAVQTFFQTVLDLIIAEDHQQAKALLSHLGEDNSTRLGYSASSRGSGIGDGLAEKFYEELSTSKALESGLITDLEDTALFIEGVREDRISDVVTNIIRRQLINYTHATAKYYGITLTKSLSVPSCWNSHARKWDEPEHADLPFAGGAPLLLVPKSIVRRKLFSDPGEYYRYYVLPFYQRDEIERQSSLVHFLKKSGQPHVYKKDVEAKYREMYKGNDSADNTVEPGVEKRINLDATDRNPDLLQKFKEDKRKHPPAALSHDDIAEATRTAEPDFQSLLDAVHSLAPGQSAADAYEKAIEALLTALLYPSLTDPVRQAKIHEGRKRIDITYYNMARDGFFKWLSANYPAGKIMVECKNYSRPLANPEYDQIAGRFSPSRGKYGLLVYRSYSDKDQVLASLKDTANDQRGFITALDDDDLSNLVTEMIEKGSATGLSGLLAQRFNALIN